MLCIPVDQSQETKTYTAIMEGLVVVMLTLLQVSQECGYGRQGSPVHSVRLRHDFISSIARAVHTHTHTPNVNKFIISHIMNNTSHIALAHSLNRLQHLLGSTSAIIHVWLIMMNLTIHKELVPRSITEIFYFVSCLIGYIAMKAATHPHK